MTALKLLSNRAGVTWLILVAATIVSWAVGAEHGTGSAVAVLVLAIAAVKVRLVGLDFMDPCCRLRHFWMNTSKRGNSVRRDASRSNSS